MTPRLPTTARNRTRSFKKPKVADVYKFLGQHNALIVHFSGTPKGGGSNFYYLYPEDLKNVVAKGALSGVCCSVVRPNDEFERQDANATGCIGVVLGLRNKNSLVAADPHDCGSFVEDGIRKVANERDLTTDDLEKTLADRPPGDYNEWVIRDYVVRGIFAARPYRVSITEVPPYPAEMDEGVRDQIPVPSFKNLAIRDLLATFSNLSIFSVGQLVRLTKNGVDSVDPTDIYKRRSRDTNKPKKRNRSPPRSR
jgi:hypothetical protein